MSELIQSLLNGISGLFGWLGRELKKGFDSGLALLAAIVAGLMTPIKAGLDFLLSLVQRVEGLIDSVGSAVTAVGMDNAGGFWSGLSRSAALANSVVPLDFCLQVGAACTAVVIGCWVISALIGAYKLIPAKMT